MQEAYYDRKDLMKQASKREEDDFFIFPNTCLGNIIFYLFHGKEKVQLVQVISFTALIPLELIRNRPKKSRTVTDITDTCLLLSD